MGLNVLEQHLGTTRVICCPIAPQVLPGHLLLLAIVILVPTQGLRCLVRKQPNNPSSVFSGFYFESLYCVCTKTNIGYTCIWIYLLFHIFSKVGD